MHPHLLPLHAGERSRLLPHGIGYADAADVVEQGGDLQALDLGVGETKAARSPHRQPGDLLGVPVQKRHLDVGEVAERGRHGNQLVAVALDGRRRLDLEQSMAGIAAVGLGHQARRVRDEPRHHRRIEDHASSRPHRAHRGLDPAELAEQRGVHRHPRHPRGDRDAVALQPPGRRTTNP